MSHSRNVTESPYFFTVLLLIVVHIQTLLFMDLGPTSSIVTVNAFSALYTYRLGMNQFSSGLIWVLLISLGSLLIHFLTLAVFGINAL